MDKIKSLNNYQKGILAFMIAMALIFAVIYPKTISKVGYSYNDAILVQTGELSLEQYDYLGNVWCVHCCSSNISYCSYKEEVS